MLFSGKKKKKKEYIEKLSIYSLILGGSVNMRSWIVHSYQFNYTNKESVFYFHQYFIQYYFMYYSLLIK